MEPDFIGKVEAVLLNQVGSSVSVAVSELRCFVGAGLEGDRHSGRRMVDAREDVARHIGLLKGVEIANLRQFSAVSAEELHDISKQMGSGADLAYGLLGENLVLSGIENFSSLPAGTQLTFAKASTGQPRSVILYITAENNPCSRPGKNITEWSADKNIRLKGETFVRSAKGRRGVVGLVKAGGMIEPGDLALVWLPGS